MTEKYKHKYKTMWTCEHGEFTAEEIREAKKGGCDEVGIISVINPPDGSLSVKFIGVDEKGNPWDHRQWFKMWALCAAMLKDSNELDELRRDIALMAHESVRVGIIGLPPSEEYQKMMEASRERSSYDS